MKTIIKKKKLLSLIIWHEPALIWIMMSNILLLKIICNNPPKLVNDNQLQ